MHPRPKRMKSPDVDSAVEFYKSPDVAAYGCLFGVQPRIGVTGTVRDTRGESAFLHSRLSTVTAIGTRRVTVDIREEGNFQMDVTANATVAHYTLHGRR